jgi:uncharacterized protein YndB with AHSA1/START domain
MEIRHMTRQFATLASTKVSRIVKAPREAVYRACIDPHAVAVWRVPQNMKGHVHVFDACEGGRFRVSLTYKNPELSPGGKTSDDTDTFHGKFVELAPYEKIVEVVEFESADPRFAGEMKITTSFADTGEGTEITVLCQTYQPAFGPKTTKSAARNRCRTWPD